jgi:hypothetical protein
VIGLTQIKSLAAQETTLKHHIISSKVSKNRISEWFLQASPVTSESTWTEKRRAVTVGEHTFLVEKEQIFQCLHCGTYDPQWSSVEVLTWLQENFGVKPFDLEVTCSVAGPILKEEK